VYSKSCALRSREAAISSCVVVTSAIVNSSTVPLAHVHMDILDCQDCRTTMLVGLLQLRISFRTTSCMASTGIYCAALCTLRCCTLVHIHPKFIIFLWIQIITIFNHNLFVFNICAIFTNRAKQILWSRFSIDQGEFLTSIEAFLPRKQPPKIQTGL